MSKRRRKSKTPVEELPVNFCKFESLSPRAHERFVARAPELNKKIGHLIKAWNGFKDADPEHKPYWLDIYKNCIGFLEMVYAEINHKG
jgi:hypothetical protein